jgi:hypothetical protein
LIAFLVIRPLFTTGQTSEAHRGLNYIRFYFGQLNELVATWDQRLLSGLVVFGPALFLAWRGWRWLLPALPLVAAALLSTGPAGSYDYRYHHHALVVPFAITAIVAGANYVREHVPKRNWRADLALTTSIVLIFNIALVDTPLNPFFWLNLPGQGRDHAMYGRLPRDALKDQFLASHVPPQAPIAASVFLASHLVGRDTLYLVRYPDDPGGQRLPSLLPAVDYVLTDALFDWRALTGMDLSNRADYEQAEIALLLREPTFGLVAIRDGLLLFQRNPLPESILHQQIEPLRAPAMPPQAEFGPLRLYSATITPLGARRYQAELVWSLNAEVPADRFVAVSSFAGVEHSRIVHLPSYIMQPLNQWQVGQTMREQFQFTLPAEVAPGTYPWRISWHTLSHSEGHATDTRSIVFSQNPITVGTITIP